LGPCWPGIYKIEKLPGENLCTKGAKDRAIDLHELSRSAVLPLQPFQDTHNRCEQIIEIVNDRREQQSQVGFDVWRFFSLEVTGFCGSIFSHASLRETGLGMLQRTRPANYGEGPGRYYAGVSAARLLAASNDQFGCVASPDHQFRLEHFSPIDYMVNMTSA
jgi:hypothetical protein